jgi:hypothetical protein
MRLEVGKWYQRRDGIPTKIISFNPFKLISFPFKCIRGNYYTAYGLPCDPNSDIDPSIYYNMSCVANTGAYIGVGTPGFQRNWSLKKRSGMKNEHQSGKMVQKTRWNFDEDNIL